MENLNYWTKKVRTIESHESIRQAAKLMEDGGISSLLIVDIERPVGIITEKDVMKSVADNMNPDETKVEDIMTKDPVTTRITADPQTVIDIMLGNGFRHMPVVDENENLIGIVSLRDLIRTKRI